MNFTPQGPQLLVGKQVVSMSEVKSISQPGVGEPTEAQPLTVPAVPGPKGNNQRLATPPTVPGASSAARAQSAEADADAGGEANSPEKMMAAMAAKMFAIGPQDSVQPKGPRKAEVKPELKANAAKAAKLSQGNINDAAMSSGLINKLNKDGAKAGMGT